MAMNDKKTNRHAGRIRMIRLDAVLVGCCFFLAAAVLNAQSPTPRSSRSVGSVPKAGSRSSPRPDQTGRYRVGNFRNFDKSQSPFSSGNAKPDPSDINPYEPPQMDFFLEWTNFQAHRVNPHGHLEIILNGRIQSTAPEVWNLSTVQPAVGGPPNLHFIEDMEGRHNAASIPLVWSISLDGGDFVDLTPLPDNSLCVTFPEGEHTFQLKTHGYIPYHNDDGYYRLQLAQSIIPQM
jgi:hypothetical protein